LSSLPRLSVAFGGPQGVGKSTVLRLLANQHPDYDAISVGDQFPPDFRSLPAPTRAQVRAQASERLESRLLANRDVVVIVDLHYLDLREADPRIQRPELLAQFDLHVLLVAPADVLLARRASDSSRADRSVSIADAERDVYAHIKYFGQESALGPDALVLDCRKGPLEVLRELERHIDDRLDALRPQFPLIAPEQARPKQQAPTGLTQLASRLPPQASWSTQPVPDRPQSG
jgi:adenylate kinase